jgi:predicted neuraminidase
MLSRWAATAVFALGLGIAISGIRPLAKPVFALPDAVDAGVMARRASALPAHFAWSDLPKPTSSAHAVTVAEVVAADAVNAREPVRLLAAWFGGSREGAADVSLYQSGWTPEGGWVSAREMLSRAEAERQLGRNIRKLGNPLLVSGPGRLQLFFVSVSYGGWAGSAINRSQSNDGGASWSTAQRIITSPFFNLSTLVRNPGSWYDDGSLGLPLYHEFISKHGEWLRLDGNGRVLSKSRLAMPRPTLQPAVVPLSGKHAVAALRDAGPGPNEIQWSETHDGGQTWAQQSARSIPNPNSAVAMIGLRDGTLLLACNPIPGNRNQLSLLRSMDQGLTWNLVRVIEDSSDDRDEFSYPALLQDRLGEIHLLYTWKRQGIRHARFSQAWLDRPGVPTAPVVPR